MRCSGLGFTEKKDSLSSFGEGLFESLLRPLCAGDLELSGVYSWAVLSFGLPLVISRFLRLALERLFLYPKQRHLDIASRNVFFLAREPLFSLRHRG